MRTYKYTGTFIAEDNGHKYELTVNCNGFIQALILLSADAIRSGRHWQLSRIENENGNVRLVDDMTNIDDLLK